MKFIKCFFNRRRIYRLIIENLILVFILFGFIIFSYFNVGSLPHFFKFNSKDSTILGKVQTGSFIIIEQDDHFQETWKFYGTPFYINNTLIIWVKNVELLAAAAGKSNRKDYLIFDDSFIVYNISQQGDTTIATDSDGNVYNIKPLDS